MAETFGETSKLGTEASTSIHKPRLIKYQSGSAGTLASISLYVKYNLTTAWAKCAIYDSSFNLVGITETLQINAGQDDWMVFDFIGSPAVNATTDYYLALWNNVVIKTYYAAGAANQYQYENKTFDTWSDPLVPDGSGAWKWSIFATYEEAPPSKKTLVQACLI